MSDCSEKKCSSCRKWMALQTENNKKGVCTGSCGQVEIEGVKSPVIFTNHDFGCKNHE